ncbi:hypothetical protein WJ972_25075 [Achromobacter insuavis]
MGTRVETAHASTRFTQRISQFPDLLQYARNAALLVQDVRTVKLTKRLAETLGAGPASRGCTSTPSRRWATRTRRWRAR